MYVSGVPSSFSAAFHIYFLCGWCSRGHIFGMQVFMPRVAIMGLMQVLVPRWTVKSLGDPGNRRRRTIVHVIVTTALLLSTLGLVIVVQDLGTFVAVVGIAGIAIGLVIPTYCYLGLRPITRRTLTDVGVPCVVLVAGVVSIIAVLVSLALPQ